MFEFLQNNWFWIVLIALFVGMHSFGGGCCGPKGDRRKENEAGDKAEVGDEKSCH